MSAPRDSSGFVHLHVHSSYSIGVGLSTPEELCAHAKRLGYDTLALTDTNGTYGFIEFHLAARKHGIKPIYGAVVHHTSVISPGRERFVLGLLATNREGLKNVAALTSLSAVAYESGVALPLEQLRDHAGGVVAFAGSAASEIASLALAGNAKGAGTAVDGLCSVFDGAFFVEIQDHGEHDEKQLAQKLLAVAESVGAETLFTQEVRYAAAEMRSLYGLVSGARHPGREEDFFRLETRDADRSMHAEADLLRYRGVYEASWANTGRVAERIGGDLLAAMEGPGALLDRFDDSRESLVTRCTEGFYKRYSNLSNSEIASYQELIAREAADIEEAGLVSVYLLYHHLLAKLRRSGIAPGPATGATLQSLCAYLLGITAYDPYHYTPEFRPMLDGRLQSHGEFEIQMASESRDAAVEWLRRSVGEDSVVYVPAVERLTAARALRMAARVVNVAEEELGDIYKVVGRYPGVSIQRMCEEDRRLGDIYKRSVAARELVGRAALLENLPSGFVKSRRSVALSATPLTDCLAHSVDADTGDVFIHASRDVLPVEAVLRIDFTPLTALGVVDRIDRQSPRREHEERRWDRVVVDDPRAWCAVRGGDTTGVFLFEGEVMGQQRDAFELRSIGDLANLLTVVRARGDSITLAERVRAYNRSAIYSGADPPEVYRILKRSNGHILYDEQLRDILSIFVDTSPSESARMLGDARSGDPAVLARLRVRFMRGMADHDMPMEMANAWFDRILFSAGQTVRRERVVADALVVYEMFRLKTRHESVFYNALLNANVKNDAKLKKYTASLMEDGRLLPVDVNHSPYLFEIEGKGIRAGLCTIRGVDEDVFSRIEHARDRGGFESVEDFIQRMEGKGLTGEQVQALVKAGAFDALAGSRKAASRAVSGVKKKQARRTKAGDPGQLELPLDE